MSSTSDQKQVSFRMNQQTFVEFRKLCLDRGLSIKEQITLLIEAELRKAQKQMEKK